MKRYFIFFVNKNGSRGFVTINAVNFKDAIIVSKSFSKAIKCEILGVCAECIESFKLDNHE